MSTFKEVCHEIGMPISPHKSVGPAQTIQFLGLTKYTVDMVIKIPEDKKADIILQTERHLACNLNQLQEN